MPAARPRTPVAVDSIAAVLAGRLVQPLFQPIVDLDSTGVVGVEALARGPAGSALEFPDRLFAAAGEAGLLGPLDMLCGERALEETMAVPDPPPLLFINAEPAVMDQPLSPRLRDLIRQGLAFRHVLEFTERSLTAVPGHLVEIAAGVQDFGNCLALDDVGVDPMSLAFLPVLEPEVIKLDMSLVHDPGTPRAEEVGAVVRAQARRTGAMVIAEGIETDEHLRSARELGANWGQGWRFGRPGPLAGAGHRYDHQAAAALPPARPGFHRPPGTPFEVARRLRPDATGDGRDLTVAVGRLRARVAGDAIVIVSGPAPAVDGTGLALRELVGRARSVIVLDRPVPGEFSVAVIGAGRGSALCARDTGAGLDLITTDDLPAVAEVTRNLLLWQRRG